MKKMKILLFLLLPCLSAMAQDVTNPVANPHSVVAFGNARFTVLTPSLLRMEWSEATQFEDRASLVFINRELPVSTFSKKTSGKKLTIKTSELTVTYTDDGEAFSDKNLRVEFLLNGDRKRWTPGTDDPLNLKGTMRTVDNLDSVTHKMLEDGIISRSGWALVDDSRQPLFSSEGWAVERPDTTALDYYLFAYGHRYKEALGDFTKVAGRIPIPPKYAFGYWYSRYYCYSDTEVKEMVTQMERFDIPLDVFIVDMDWHNTYDISKNRNNFLGWTGYSWNKSLFPDPEGFFDWMHSRNLKVSLNLHPARGIYNKEDCFVPFAKALGADTTGVERFDFKLEDKNWADAYFRGVINPLERQGVDFWWIDWQQWERAKTMPSLKNVWWLNHNFFTNMEQNRETRPLLFHRWGGLGNHRYPVGFSGDSHATFKMLESMPYFTSTASNVGFGYWSNDIGGFIQRSSQTDPELYLRWMQMGVFSPILRTHGSKQGAVERRIWKFSNFDLMNDALHLRYALVPYIYTAARQGYDTGVSICRPMYYDHPEVELAYTSIGQYMFGDDIMVHPVHQRANANGLVSQTTWLPEGLWYSMSSGSTLQGGVRYDATYTHNEIPWFVKSGAIIPMNPKVNNLQTDPQHVVFAIVPGESGKGTLYEDAGGDKSYKNGEFATTEITQKRSDNRIETILLPRKGSYNDMPVERAYTFRFIGLLPPDRAVVNGRELRYFKDNEETDCWSYDATNMELIVRLSQTKCDEQIRIVIDCATDNDLAVTDGIKSSFARMTHVISDFKVEIAKVDWARSPSELMLAMSQIPSMIEADPARAKELIMHYKNNINKAFENIEQDYEISTEMVSKYKTILGL